MEMRLVLRRVLERAVLRPAERAEPDEVQFRAITLAPREGVPVRLQRTPAARD